MIELELRKINYTEGGNNYVAQAEAENHCLHPIGYNFAIRALYTMECNYSLFTSKYDANKQCNRFIGAEVMYW